MTDAQTFHTATFGAGCFWGVEESFRVLDGVIDTMVGYEGGVTENPSYREVCTDRTGHAEVVQVTFNPRLISYETLLAKFFATHDPTQLNRQGPDEGTQYRSVIFFIDENQARLALDAKEALEASGRFAKPIATQIVPATTFWPAEDYHQKYLLKRGLTSCEL
jgi:peptide-methionine (S)-S-oxide reductase